MSFYYSIVNKSPCCYLEFLNHHVNVINHIFIIQYTLSKPSTIPINFSDER